MATAAFGWLVLALLAWQETDRWVEVKPEDGSFSAEMPAEPKFREFDQGQGADRVCVKEYSCIVGGRLYRLEQTTLPGEVPDDRLAAFLDGTRKFVASRTTVIEERDVTVAGWPGVEFLVEAPLRPGAKPTRFAMLALVADGRFYQIRAFAAAPGKEPEDARRLIDSFRPAKERPSP